MLKKILSCIILICMLLLSTVTFANSPITVYLDCSPISFDEEPVIVDGRTLVPVRSIFEAMGAKISWDGEAKTVTSTLDKKTAVFTIDSKIAMVNGVPKEIDASPQIIDGKTMVPARAVSEMFDCNVLWDGVNRRVLIETMEFSEKVKTAKKFSSVDMIDNGTKRAVSALSIMYVDGYEIKTDTTYGTNIELSYDTETAHANLNIRSDIYSGATPTLSDEYVKIIAEDMVEVVSGTLVSYGTVTINEADFMKIEYTAPRTVSGITDKSSDITVYICVSGDVVYTITLSLYGDVEKSIKNDLNYTINSILIP